MSQISLGLSSSPLSPSFHPESDRVAGPPDASADLSLGLRSKFNIFYCYIFYRIARGLTSDNVKGLFVGMKTGQAFFPLAVFSDAIHYQ